MASPHRHVGAATANGWDAVEMDLSDLDLAAAERRAQREKTMGRATEAGASRRRHRRSRGSTSAGRIGRSEFNRRVQLVLFVALLLLGVVVVFRACSSGSRRVEPEPLGHARMNSELRI